MRAEQVWGEREDGFSTPAELRWRNHLEKLVPSVRLSASLLREGATLLPGMAKPVLRDGVFLVAVMRCASRRVLITGEPVRFCQTLSVR